jgi:hypothetical protein
MPYFVCNEFSLMVLQLDIGKYYSTLWAVNFSTEVTAQCWLTIPLERESIVRFALCLFTAHNVATGTRTLVHVDKYLSTSTRRLRLLAGSEISLMKLQLDIGR